MNLTDHILKQIRFIRTVYKNRNNIRSLLGPDNLDDIFHYLLESDNRDVVRSLFRSNNSAFIRFSPPGHFYSPIPDLNEIHSSSTYIFDRSKTDIPSIAVNRELQIQLAKSFSVLYEEMPFPDGKSQEWRYFLDNPYFSYGDGIILYSFLRHFSPKRVLEVGSGFSSCEMLDTNDFFLDKKVQFTFIEPFPHRLLGLLSEGDKKTVRIETKRVQEIESTIFGLLEANDILFIDSSHVGKMNSDVLYILFDVLPQLKQGVIIHFHDILWPFEYPKNWIEEGRAWNEAYFIHSFLQYNQAFEILYFNSYMELHHADLLRTSMPGILKAPSSKVTPGNSSLWIRKVL
jgi:hypothetical protein